MPDQITKPQAPRVPRLSIEAREAELELERAKARASAKAAERAQVIEKVKVAAGAKEPLDQKLRIGIVAGAVFILIVALLFGTPPVKIVASVMCLGVLQGLWRGATELVGIVVSSIIAVLVAPSLGRAMEGLTSGLTGNHGLQNRMVAVASVGLLIVVVGSILVSLIAKRTLKKHPRWVRWNSIGGAALGLIEGVILGMAILWTPLALEPIATVAETEAGPANSSSVASGIRAFAGRVRDSSLGKVAEATNPIEGSRLLSLANDFVLVSRDEAAMDWFMKTPVMQELANLPSIGQAKDRINADPALKSTIEEQGVSVDLLTQVLKSRTILDIFDQTSVVSDLTPRADRLVTAIGEAKARIGRHEPRR